MFTIENIASHPLDVVHYEISMLKKSFEILEQLSEEDPVAKNAYLESFLLHARNLIYFLENLGPSDDIRCSNFNVDVALTGFSKDQRDKLHKHLSHIGKDRCAEKIRWLHAEIFEKLADSFRHFLAALPASNFPTPEGKTRQHFEQLLQRTQS